MERCKQWLDPAATVIDTLGGCMAVARILGIRRQLIYRWVSPKPSGTGGIIPSAHLAPLLDFAEQHGIALTPEMLIRGSQSREKRGRK